MPIVSPHIKDADIQFFLPPTVPGFGNASGFELRLQDKTAGTFAELDEVAKNVRGEAER